MNAPDTPTFKDILVIDICLSKDNVRNTWTDKSSLVHQDIMIRLNMKILMNNTELPIAWKKVNWKNVVEEREDIRTRNCGWNYILDLVNELCRKC